MPTISTDELKRELEQTRKAKQAVLDAGRLVGDLRNRIPYDAEAENRAKLQVPLRQNEYVIAACQATEKLFELIEKSEKRVQNKDLGE
ncbi:hypothetical protein [Pseudomonas vranovensis]|uniref:hypothetical protein n=1 Tax=Pseudomonas vranovensis TaxID=321661 RepID=UPI003D991687